MIYLDANVFLYATAGVENKAIMAERVLTAVASGKMDACTSALTWDELVWNLRKVLDRDVVREEGEKFILFPNLKLLSVDTAVITEAQRLVTEYNVKPRDAIHAASATKHGIKELVSDDPDFDVVAEIKRIKLEDVR